MNRILIILFLLINLSACAQIQVDIPKNFLETEIPEVSSDKWFELNHSRNEFGVKIIDNKLNIEKVKGSQVVFTKKIKHIRRMSAAMLAFFYWKKCPC